MEWNGSVACPRRGKPIVSSLAIGVTWGRGRGGKMTPQYFFNLGILYLVTELSNGK
jgi:hypothetical protein